MEEPRLKSRNDGSDFNESELYPLNFMLTPDYKAKFHDIRLLFAKGGAVGGAQSQQQNKWIDVHAHNSGSVYKALGIDIEAVKKKAIAAENPSAFYKLAEGEGAHWEHNALDDVYSLLLSFVMHATRTDGEGGAGEADREDLKLHRVYMKEQHDLMMHR